MNKTRQIILWVVAALIIIVGLAAVSVWTITFHPPWEQAETVRCEAETPTLQPGQRLKVLTYNVQYMAGKNYFFFYEGGSDERPSAGDIGRTFDEIAGIIGEEEPDVVLLQELDDESKRTDYQDQLARLLELLPDDYRCHVSAYYWQADFVPHPQIWGPIGHKLSIVSRYRIDQATRYQLPLASTDPLTRQFSPKRAILEAQLPVSGASDFFILTTHLEVSNRGAEVMQRQTSRVAEQLAGLSRAGSSWLIGGDFNLLPPGQFSRLREDQRSSFRPETELRVLFENYRSLPDPADLNGSDEAQGFTFLPNDPGLQAPDRTLDYFFFSDDLAVISGYIRDDERALTASDHLPVIVEITLP
jgi:endonuclease/exonuclease/phosphatase family metal-dependent hydrolase